MCNERKLILSVPPHTTGGGEDSTLLRVFTRSSARAVMGACGSSAAPVEAEAVTLRKPIEGLDDLLKATGCENRMQKATAWFVENEAECVRELLRAPDMHEIFLSRLELPPLKQSLMRQELAQRHKELSAPRLAAADSSKKVGAPKGKAKMPNFVRSSTYSCGQSGQRAAQWK
jgi:hypothetical protein